MATQLSTPMGIGHSQSPARGREGGRKTHQSWQRRHSIRLLMLLGTQSMSHFTVDKRRLIHFPIKDEPLMKRTRFSSYTSMLTTHSHSLFPANIQNCQIYELIAKERCDGRGRHQKMIQCEDDSTHVASKKKEMIFPHNSFKRKIKRIEHKK